MMRCPSSEGNVCKTFNTGAIPVRISNEVNMEEICKFIINNNIYTIYNVDKITGKQSYVGRSDYDDRTLYVEKR